MITLIIILVMAAIVLGIALAFALWKPNTPHDTDSDYRNEEGDHYYYDRSLIEKKVFKKHFPDSSLRSFSNPFRSRKK